MTAQTDHHPTIRELLTDWDASPQWQARCPACDWTHVSAIRRALVIDAAKAHEWQHHPERRPAPEPPTPAHGIASTHSDRSGTQTGKRCYCGKGWIGATDVVADRMAAHLAAMGVT